jgi:hypothetical protein
MIEGFNISDARAIWGARARLSQGRWNLSRVASGLRASDKRLRALLEKGALERAEQSVVVTGRAFYPSDAIVCVVDEGALVVCVHYRSDRELDVSAFLRPAGAPPLPGAYYDGQDNYERLVDTSAWFAAFRRSARPKPVDKAPLAFGDGPQMFVHEGARSELERRFPVPVELVVTDNRQNMVTYRDVSGTLRVRAHCMFLDAPRSVQKALVGYVVDGNQRHVVGDYVRANGHRIRAARETAPARAKGQAHDLDAIVKTLAKDYFGDSIAGVRIAWGRRATRGTGARSAIKLGTYNAVEQLVRVHPALDASWVPRYFVSYVVYHELLHHVVPPVRSGRRVLKHPPEFVRRERLFPQYDRAIMWEQLHIDQILTS